MRGAAVLACLAGLASLAQAADPAPERGAWFNEAKFGLFIHWGIYSVPAGVYDGKEVERTPGHPSAGEWIMHDAQIPVATYARYAAEFNPVHFDAASWVKIAQEAGMKYIVITAKHHDGFAMFRSAASSFNIVDGSPFGRDPLKELAAACRKAGLRLGFYYSQAQDWSHPGGAAWGHSGPMLGGDPGQGRWDSAQQGDFDAYLDRVAIPQVRELLTGYGPVAVLWWDTPVGMTPARAARLAPLLKLQPQMLTNNRLLDPDRSNPYSGDTETPEQVIPATGLKGRKFEVCMTMNDTWGYKVHDQNWKSAGDILRKLIDIASKGGNFLLNVGPTAEGEFPPACIERLETGGRWVHANQEALYGTTASLFRRLIWGRSTTRGRALYLEVFDWPANGRLIVPGLSASPAKTSLLVSGQVLSTHWEGKDLVVAVPQVAPDRVATVLKLEFASAPSVDQPLPGPDAAGNIVLPSALAAIVNSYTGNARIEGQGEEAHIAHWDRAGISASWDFKVNEPGRYAAEAEVIAHDPLVFHFGGAVAGRAAAAISPGPSFHWTPLGTLALTGGAAQTFTLSSAGTVWSDVQVRAVRLRRVAP